MPAWTPDATPLLSTFPRISERDVLAGHRPKIQLNIDATRMTQAFNGNMYVQEIINGEVNAFAQRHRLAAALPVNLDLRVKFNPNLYRSWYTAVMELINQITILSVVLTGAALIREREHGTIEHLLVMPVTPFEIMVSKVWSMGLVVVIASAFSVPVIIQGILAIPVTGSVPLFLAGTALFLFATTSMAILMATIARTMPQFGMLVLLVLLPLLTLSGAFTPRESMPEIVQTLDAGRTQYAFRHDGPGRSSSAAPGSISSGRNSLPWQSSAPSSSAWPWLVFGNPWKPRH